MPLYLSHRSALEYWRSYPTDAACPRFARVKEIRRLSRAFDAKKTPDSLAGDTASKGLSRPAHILVPDKRSRCQSGHVVSHVCRAPVPPRSLVPISEDAYSSTPELCFVHMADSLTFSRLVCLGFELCGSYSLNAANPKGFVGRIPLSSASRIATYLDDAGGMRGIRGHSVAYGSCSDLSVADASLRLIFVHAICPQVFDASSSLAKRSAFRCELVSYDTAGFSGTVLSTK